MTTACRHWFAALIAFSVTIAGAVALPSAAWASGPVATVVLAPTSVTAGSTGNVFTVTVTAKRALSGHTTVRIPGGWTAPQASSPSGPGYVTTARGTCKSAGNPVVSGTGPWAITFAVTCALGRHFTLTYGAGTGTTKVQAPTTAASYQFTASVKLGTATHPLTVPPVVVGPGPAASLAVTGLPTPSETGVPLPVTVTARDAYGNVATGYTGTVRFTSSDAGAALPADYTFTTADAGAHAFPGGVMFAHEGTQSVTATDTVNSAVTGTDSVPVNGVLFVTTTGADTNPGTQSRPFRTIGAAVATAAASSPPFAVDVAGGSYSEGSGVAVTSGITIDGGFDPATWTQSGSEVTTITGAPQAVLADGATGVLLETLTLQASAPGQYGQSAYGVRAVNGASLTLDGVTVSAGNGQQGTPGTSGFSGANGSNGSPGGNGQSSGGCTSSYGSGGAGGSNTSAPGGRGGDGGCSGGNGSNGATGTTAPGGAPGGGGGSGGAGDNQPRAGGGSGVAGSRGASGVNGIGGSNFLSFATATWSGDPGGSGTFGQPGGGGGGGGGGGALTTGCPFFCTYNGGGGGGGGGAGGGGGGYGTGGSCGGGSFGIYLWNSTVTLSSSKVSAGTGGPGGNGGNGGPAGGGGQGAGGGGGSNGSGTGGPGGGGGTGGYGGSGAGGAGGPGIGIFRGGSSSATTGSSDTITAGTGGFGGRGGVNGQSAAPNGQQGQSGAMLP